MDALNTNYVRLASFEQVANCELANTIVVHFAELMTELMDARK